MLQTAVAKVLTLVQKAKKTAEKVILQFELLNTYYSKLSCKMSYTPKYYKIISFTKKSFIFHEINNQDSAWPSSARLRD